MENTIINQFTQFSLTDTLLRGVERMSFTEPTPVQEAAIPAMLQGGDLLVQAPTGTGKTCAFGIPLIEKVDPDSRQVQALVLCPTRELALQTAQVLRTLAACKPGVRVQALYGGEHIVNQIRALKRKPQVIVATPGRLMDHMRRSTVRLSGIRLAVLDEADRMLDMGFRADIETILQGTPAERQTVLFSATLSAEIRRIAEQYQSDAQHIQIRSEALTVDRVRQFYSEIRGSKVPAVTELLRENRFDLSLIFVATKAEAERLAVKLGEEGFRAGALHGDMRQHQRDEMMRKYRHGKVRVLVATDVAARGLDVSNIDAVINYDIPGDSESYVHRIGRTGRATREGVAHTLIRPAERQKLLQIMRSTGAEIEPTGHYPALRELPPASAQRGGRSSYGGNRRGNSGSRRPAMRRGA